MSLKDGEAIVLPRKGAAFDPLGIPGAVRDAGFTPRELRVTVLGALAFDGGAMRLQVPGLGYAFLLEGPKAEELRRHEELAGRRVRVSGVLQAGKEGARAKLRVETWSAVSPRT